MILINRTQTKIHSHHRREVFLQPGPNEIDEATLTTSERAMIDGFIKAGIVERRAEPLSVIIGANVPGVETLTADEARARGYPDFGSAPPVVVVANASDGPVQTSEESQSPKRRRARGDRS